MDDYNYNTAPVYSILGQIHLVIVQLQYNTNPIFNHINCPQNPCPEHLQTEQTNCWSHKLWLTKELYWIKDLLRLNWLTYHITTMSDLWQSSRNIFSSYYILWKDWLNTCLGHYLVEPRTGPLEKLNTTKRKVHISPLTRHMIGFSRGSQILKGSCLSCKANMASSKYTPAWQYSQKYWA